jgi:hypothetical protein
MYAVKSIFFEWQNGFPRWGEGHSPFAVTPDTPKKMIFASRT